MKAMTAADRIASVDYETQERVIYENRAGRGMKHLATDYGIPETTVRAIIRDSKITDRPRLAIVPRECPVWNAVISPGWHCHGTLTPEQARLYPSRGVSSCR